MLCEVLSGPRRICRGSVLSWRLMVEAGILDKTGQIRGPLFGRSWILRPLSWGHRDPFFGCGADRRGDCWEEILVIWGSSVLVVLLEQHLTATLPAALHCPQQVDTWQCQRLSICAY